MCWNKFSFSLNGISIAGKKCYSVGRKRCLNISTRIDQGFEIISIFLNYPEYVPMVITEIDNIRVVFLNTDVLLSFV